MSKYKKNDYERAIDNISDAIIIIRNIRDKEEEKTNIRSALTTDLSEVISDLSRASNGIDYISNEYY